MICGLEINSIKNIKNCIYIYTNLINNKKYVGQTVRSLYDRHKQRMTDCFNKNKHCYKQPFYRAIRKYGIENFKLEVLRQDLETQCLLNLFECYYIKKYNTMINGGYGYNISNGGSNGNTFAGKSEEEMNEIRRKMSNNNWMKKISPEETPFYGKHHTDESKRKIGDAHKGKHLTEEHKRKTSNTMNSRSDEEKEKWRNKIKKTWNSKSQEEIDEIKNRMREINKGENNYWYGKHLSDETKKKLSVANYGLNNPNARSVVQLDKNMNLIKVWDYAKQVENEKKWFATTITSCCRGKQKTAYGYIWMYAENHQFYQQLNELQEIDKKLEYITNK